MTTELSAKTPLLSVVAPVYCEEDGIREFYDRTTEVLESVVPPVDHELIFVDDGSTDDSLAIMRKMADEDPRVRTISLSRNFGHQVAITAGINDASGDAVVVIDADLQDPPQVIADMVRLWRDGLKMVYGKRIRRHGENPFKLFTAKTFYRLLGWLSDTPLPFDTGDFRLMDRKVIDALAMMHEENRYLRGMVAWVGFAQGAVEYERDARYAGSSKFDLRKMVRFALDGITSFSEKPLRLTTRLGLVAMTASVLLASWIVIERLTGSSSGIAGYASLMCAVLFLGGVQLLSIGILGEYLGRTYRETKRRPLYVVADRYGFPEE